MVFIYSLDDAQTDSLLKKTIDFYEKQFSKFNGRYLSDKENCFKVNLSKNIIEFKPIEVVVFYELDDRIFSQIMYNKDKSECVYRMQCPSDIYASESNFKNYNLFLDYMDNTNECFEVYKEFIHEISRLF